jgi:hypothetical protein
MLTLVIPVPKSKAIPVTPAIHALRSKAIPVTPVILALVKKERKNE